MGPTIDEVRNLIEKLKKDIINLEGNNGIGIGRNEKGEYCIHLNFQKKSQFPKNFPKNLDGIDIICKEIGIIKPAVSKIKEITNSRENIIKESREYLKNIRKNFK